MSARTVNAVNRLCKLISLMQAAAPAPRSVKELLEELDWIHNVQPVYSSVWRDLLTMEKHELVERVKRPGQLGWAFKLKGISDDLSDQNLDGVHHDRRRLPSQGLETSMNCRICNKAIVLVPSASERAARFGGTPEFYTRLFTTHGTCQVAQRSQAAVETMRRLNGRSA